ncbi:hypothetical protein C922_01626 [Plasmodium inui San Antonio 1]|uniref:PPPDE domain-containing protein n=1 Tax=Plasmodium inui San Antonio 1 TaxID=1237626 RepID=W7AGB4_9APIC|nr:hypothetical protein C922_01626 [Plasmodium inui San Antonio 1]EUD68014.1 hypothetical protein C922_01626 [Plasmodium inui San Antonio 1]
MNIWLHTYTLDVPFFLKNVRHTGIELFGSEYTFSMDGITTCKPKKSTIGQYCKSYELTSVEITYAQFSEILNALGKIYRPNTYNFVCKNCNHFCDDLFELLSGKRLFHTFMIYSRLGKLFGNFKNLTMCGYIDSMELSCNDKEMYVYALKLSKSIIRRNRNVPVGVASKSQSGLPTGLPSGLTGNLTSPLPSSFCNNLPPSLTSGLPPLHFNKPSDDYFNRFCSPSPVYIMRYASYPNDTCMGQNAFYGQSSFNGQNSFSGPMDSLPDEAQKGFLPKGQFRTIYSISTNDSFSMA